jgi:hypothetical protein
VFKTGNPRTRLSHVDGSSPSGGQCGGFWIAAQREVLVASLGSVARVTAAVEKKPVRKVKACGLFEEAPGGLISTDAMRKCGHVRQSDQGTTTGSFARCSRTEALGLDG